MFFAFGANRCGARDYVETTRSRGNSMTLGSIRSCDLFYNFVIRRSLSPDGVFLAEAEPVEGRSRLP